VQSLEINYSPEYFWGLVVTFVTNFLFVPTPTSHLYGIHLCSLLLNSCSPHNSEHICIKRATHSFVLILCYKMTKLHRNLWTFFSMKHMTLCTAYNFLTASQYSMTGGREREKGRVEIYFYIVYFISYDVTLNCTLIVCGVDTVMKPFILNN